MRHDLRFIIEIRLLASVTLAGALSLFLSTYRDTRAGGLGLTTRLRF